MSSRRLSTLPSGLRRWTALLLASLIVGSVGCKPTAAGGPVDRGAKRRERSERRGVGQRQQAAVAARNIGMLAAGYGTVSPRARSAEFVAHQGFIVKGTDLLTFWPCGENNYFYMKTLAGVAARIGQQYRFQAPRAYAPMFAQIKMREVSDTVKMGEAIFTRVVEVSDFTPTVERPAGCKQPTRAEMNRAFEKLFALQSGR